MHNARCESHDVLQRSPHFTYLVTDRVLRSQIDAVDVFGQKSHGKVY